MGRKVVRSMAKRKTVLAILPWLPYPLISGGHQAIFNGLYVVKNSVKLIITYKCEKRSLASEKSFIEAMNGEVTIIPYVFAPPVNKKPWYIRSYKALKESLKKIINGKDKSLSVPNQEDYHLWVDEFLPMEEGFVCFVNDIISKSHVDIVQCEMARNLPFVLSLPSRVVKIFVHHELRYVTKQLSIQYIQGHDIDKLSYLRFIEVNEVAMLNLFDKVVTLSSVDKDKLVSQGVTPDITVSYPVISSKGSCCEHVCLDRKILSFVGSGGHSPNYIGLLWFLKECWSALEGRGYSLQVIGYWPDLYKNDIINKYGNVSFCGFVEELKEVVKNTIMIVPITIGSGIRMKILESALMGVPVITTSIGVEGIPFENGRHCLIADTSEDFISAIDSMTSGNCDKMVRNAYLTVSEVFSYKQLYESRIKLYNI